MFHHLSNKTFCIYIFLLSLILDIYSIIFFRSLFVHGFVVDKNGRKMSKSIGNVIDPQDIVNGNYDKSINGIDVLR